MAVVGDRVVSRARLDRRIERLRRGPLARQLPPDDGGALDDMRRLVARQLVTEEILALESNAAGVGGARRTEVGEPVRHLFERVTADVTVADSDVRAYYERNLDRYRIREARRVRHVLLADEATARGVVRELRSGASLAELAAQHSIDAGTRTLGGDLGEVHRGELAGPLELALFEAEVGAIIGPIQTEHGWHVAAVESWQPAAHVPYDDVRASIEAELLEAARASAFGAWLEERRAALAVMDPGFSHPADPVHGRPSHRH